MWLKLRAVLTNVATIPQDSSRVLLFKVRGLATTLTQALLNWGDLQGGPAVLFKVTSYSSTFSHSQLIKYQRLVSAPLANF